MNLTNYIRANRTKLSLAVVLALGAFCVPAIAAAAPLLLMGDTAEGDGASAILAKALATHGTAIKTFTERADEQHKEIKSRLQDVEQKLDQRSSGQPDGGRGADSGEMTDLIMKSEGFTAFIKGNTNAIQVEVPARLFKTAIVNATGQSQPLVAADRRPGIVQPAQRRFTIRDLFTQLPTNSNLIEFCRELLFTNSAGPQYDASSPAAAREGVAKPESGLSFELANTPVITLAHFIPASRQVLSDAAQLQQHIENRLLYGLKLEEEDELLNGAGANGELNGLINNAAAFAGGSTNLSALDAVALGIGQLIAAEMQPSGIILNAADWWSSKFMLAKNSQGEYLLGNPADMAEPRLWGLPVVATNTMPVGKFMVLDAARVGYIADRENAIVRIAEQHADYFVRNMVAILCEERLAIVIQIPAAMVYGNLNYAG